MKRARKMKPELLAAEWLEPIRIAVEEKRISVQAIVVRLEKVTGERWHRQTVNSWLSGKRQPSLGDGLLIRKVFETV